MASSGPEAVELAARAGLILDPWQVRSIDLWLGERADGSWAAREFAAVVPRQSGKGGLIEARTLFGLFLLGESLIIHSAHLFATSMEAFRRMRDVIEGTPEFSRRVKPRGIKSGNTDQSIQLLRRPARLGVPELPASRLVYKARTKGGAGRGFTSDLMILDEAMYLPTEVQGALMPVVSARPRAQIAYLGSAVDQAVHEDGHVLASLRRRAIEGDDPSLAYVEWGAGGSLADAADLLDDEDAWARANPAYGIRITREAVAAERRSMDPRSFAVERLGIGDWPSPDGAPNRKIAPEAWASLAELDCLKPTGPLHACVDVTPDRSFASIAVAGRRDDGLAHVELVDHQPGAAWAVDRLAAMHAARPLTSVRVDENGPAMTLVRGLRDRGLPVVVVKAGEMAESCGTLHQAVVERTVRHPASLREPGGALEVDAALKGAATRQIGDAWAWTRRSSRVTISPLVACTLALWGLSATVSEPRRHARSAVSF